MQYYSHSDHGYHTRQLLLSRHKTCIFNESLSLLDHIQPTSILVTQLRAKSEAVLLRERVLSDTVTEQDELIHREEKSESRQRMLVLLYLFW